MSYLFFAPYNAIWQHALPESLVARTLKENGNQVEYLSCNSTFNQYCIAMSAYGLSFSSTAVEKSKVCNTCLKHTKLLTSKATNELHFIEDFITREQRNEIERLLIQLDNERASNANCFTDDLRLFATYTLILTHKLTDKNQIILDDLYYPQYRNEYRQVLISYYAIKNYFAKKKVTGLFVYNSFYPTNRTVAWVASQNHIPVYWLHAGGSLHNRLHTLNIGTGHHYTILHSWLDHWQKTYQHKPCSLTGINHVTQHYLSLLQGKNIFIYSSTGFKPEGMHAFFKIPPDKKVILAVLSSQDERIAVESINVLQAQRNLPFHSQIEWLLELINFAKRNPSLYFIMRVHPRDFPNRRDSLLSPQALILKNLFIDLPENVKINWPTDNISLYQLATITDVGLHAGSTVGKELSLLGIPTVNYMNNGLSYPYNLSYWGGTIEDYFKAIDSALEESWSYKTVVNAFRWSSLELYEGLWFLDNEFDELKENKALPPIKKMINRFYPSFLKSLSVRKAKPIKDHKLLLEMIETNAISRLDLQPTQDKDLIDPFAEKKAIFNALDNIFSAIYKNIKNVNDYKLLHKLNAAKESSQISANL